MLRKRPPDGVVADLQVGRYYTVTWDEEWPWIPCNGGPNGSRTRAEPFSYHSIDRNLSPRNLLHDPANAFLEFRPSFPVETHIVGRLPALVDVDHFVQCNARLIREFITDSSPTT